MKTRLAALSAALLLLAAPAARAQQTIGVSFDYMGYSFDEGLGATAAQLFMMPVAVRFPLSDVLTLDLYSAWAQGKVEQDDVQYSLSGPVDTRVSASYQASPWALLSLSAGLPTGKDRHTGEEAVVSAVLATDLLGFREATWGTGLSVTSSVATAMRAGGFGIGLAGAYSMRGEFEPSEDQELQYTPGNETRVRLGLDRNIGNSTLTFGGTFISYSADETNLSNLFRFQAGNRLRFDATYAFRAGAGVWTLYLADVVRDGGDLTLGIVDETGVAVSDTTLATAKQNLFIAGMVGTIGLGAYQFRPQVDFKYQSREEPGGSDEGSGWILAAGGDFPVRLFGAYDFFPKARILFGSIVDPNGTGRGVMGAEFTGTVRWSF